ncbi:hypothetical protein [Nocardioides caldifontis]|nr:hypothetical protein [Nocardioides caldifontis]
MTLIILSRIESLHQTRGDSEIRSLGSYDRALGLVDVVEDEVV